MLRISDPSGGVKPLKKEKTDMAKNILILSASLRAGSNSETLANAFADGARAAGHAVEVISLRGKNIAFCRGCLACQTLGRCVIDDDAVAIGNEFVKMIFVSFLNSNIYLLKKRLTSRVGIFLETPYSKASSHFPIASH